MKDKGKVEHTKQNNEEEQSRMRGRMAKREQTQVGKIREDKKKGKKYMLRMDEKEKENIKRKKMNVI